MGAEAGSSLLMHVGLLGVGFVLGRIQLLPLLLQLMEELYALSFARKVLMGASFAALIGVYVLAALLPLSSIADQEARNAEKHLENKSPTSFRRELRRRGSYSMSYVTDIKAHVFARS
ncbi:hypothetical protein Poli38472_003992 [Pythium oligandrum]|uniref:Uncharacterized protein n=1 Tax=Pythium oligandrum TaxID=41045 RepID=A0A8K1FNU3_PYTOL|nr:hypothetical protein Poli38472_003992 [Pythium oligandrum]|eukprot:TMW66227.1 hypothetical protein Poli38472_003992 [Pythium oligandrum]